MPNLNVNILGRDGNTRAKVTGQEELLVSVGSISPTAGLATEATLLSVDSNAAQLVTNTTPVNRTPSVANFTGPGSTTAGVYSFSIANVGAADGTVYGVTIPAGMTLNFDGGPLNNTLSSISFDATGTRFIITYIS